MRYADGNDEWSGSQRRCAGWPDVRAERKGRIIETINHFVVSLRPTSFGTGGAMLRAPGLKLIKVKMKTMSGEGHRRTDGLPTGMSAIQQTRMSALRRSRTIKAN